MKKNLIFLCLCVLLVTITGCNLDKKKGHNNGIAVAHEGGEAPDFTLHDSDGLLFTLSSLRGQYVVLDFWGTWCKWCIKGIPDMKDIYERYNGKFEILSVNIGDTEDNWQDAIDAYDMNWLNVYASDEDAQLLYQQYALEGFPTKIIIDPDGKILSITVGEDPEFYRILEEILQ